MFGVRHLHLKSHEMLNFGTSRNDVRMSLASAAKNIWETIDIGQVKLNDCGAPSLEVLRKYGGDGIDLVI